MGLGGGEQGPHPSALSHPPSPSDVCRLVTSDGTRPVTPSPEKAWGPQASLCPSTDRLWPSLCHRPGPTQLPMCSLTCVRVCVCARLCPLLCREAVPVPRPNKRMAAKAAVMQLSVCVVTASLLLNSITLYFSKMPPRVHKTPAGLAEVLFFWP